MGMDDHFDIARVFEIGKFDITRLTCTHNLTLTFFFYLTGPILINLTSPFPF